MDTTFISNFEAKKGHHGFDNGEPEFLRGSFEVDTGDHVGFDFFVPRSLRDYGIVFFRTDSDAILTSRVILDKAGHLTLDEVRADSAAPGTDSYRILNSLGDHELQFLARKFQEYL